jgi:hypothetical protein
MDGLPFVSRRRLAKCHGKHSHGKRPNVECVDFRAQARRLDCHRPPADKRIQNAQATEILSVTPR